MPLTNSQILGVLKRLTADREALDAVRLTCAAYLEAAEGLATIDNTKAQKMKEISAIEEQIKQEGDRFQKATLDHKAELTAMAKERDKLRTSINELTIEVRDITDSVADAVQAKQTALAGYEHQISEAQKTLQSIKDEIEAMKKRFAA